ncbi:hypothetical protein B0H14DRAFT_3438900 [Mycena olivaceomarginata]|nr:hypothetical protein B0H14DRAFT_3438900 [Mycena olivaceomarginata]
MPGTVAPASAPSTTSLIIHTVSKRPATKSVHYGLHGISRAALDYFGTPKSSSIAPVGRSPSSARATRSAQQPAAFALPPSHLPPWRLPPGALQSDPRAGLACFGRPHRFLIAPSARTTPSPWRPAAFALPWARPQALAAPRHHPALMPTLPPCTTPRASPPPPPPFLPACPTPPAREKMCVRTGQEDTWGSPNAEPPCCRPPLPTVEWAGDAPPPRAFSRMAGIEVRPAGWVGKAARIAHAS